MTSPLIAPAEFVGLEGIAHLCAGGELPSLADPRGRLARAALEVRESWAS